MNCEELQILIEEAEQLEFPYCDVAHEDVTRNELGEMIIQVEEQFPFISECPVNVQLKRPACTHCGSDNALLKLRILLGSHDLIARYRDSNFEQYAIDSDRLDVLDREMRFARTGRRKTLLEKDEIVPNLKSAQKRASQLIEEHRGIVDRMRRFRDDLVVIAREALKQM